MTVTTTFIEEIDNPRMRGRKLGEMFLKEFHFLEEIDNPRMRGRKREHFPALVERAQKKLIIPG